MNTWQLNSPSRHMLILHSSADGSACGRKENMTDREKVLAWLAHISETCQQIIDEVIEQCRSDPEARAYFVRRHDEDVLQLIAA